MSNGFNPYEYFGISEDVLDLAADTLLETPDLKPEVESGFDPYKYFNIEEDSTISNVDFIGPIQSEFETPDLDTDKFIGPPSPEVVTEGKFDALKFMQNLENREKTLGTITQKEIDSDDLYVKNEYENVKKDVGFKKRMMVKFLEGLSPIPLDYSSEYTEPEDATTTALGHVSYATGFATSFVGSGFLVGGLKIIGSGTKATQALAKASKGYTELARVTKIAKSAKITAKGRASYLGRAMKQEALIDKELAKAGVVGTNSLLGKQKHYKALLSRIGSTDYEVGKFLSRIKVLKKPPTIKGITAANALDSGLTNIAASTLMTQKSIPIGEEGFFVKERLTKPLMEGLLFTAVGLPRILGAGKVGNLVLNSGVKGTALEAGMVYATFMGASHFGYGIRGEGETSWENSLVDGAIGTAVHYMGVGADRIAVKEAIKNGIRVATDNKEVQKKVLSAMSNDALDEIKLYLDTSRPQYLRNRFVAKKKVEGSEKVVQLTGIKQNKKGDHVLNYQVLKAGDGTSGETFTELGKTRSDVLNKFYSTYKNVLSDPKTIQKTYLKKNPNVLKPGSFLKANNKQSYDEHQKIVKSIVKKESKLGINTKEASNLRRKGFTKSYGNMERMSMEELKTYKNMLGLDKKINSIRQATVDNHLPFEVPTDFLSKRLTTKGMKTYGYSFEANLNGWGKAGAILSRKIADYADTKAIVRGSASELKDNVTKDFGLKIKDFDLITALNKDEKLLSLIDPNEIKKIKNPDLLQKSVRNYFNETFMELAKNNGKVRIREKQFVPVLKVYDRVSGKVIKVSDESFDNGDVLNVLNRKGKTVLNKDGKKINVDVEKTIKNSAYVSDYTPRYLTEKAMSLLGKDASNFKKQLRAYIKARNPDADKGEIEQILYSFDKFADSKKPLGILNTRKVDIPPYVLIEKGTNRLIQLDEIPNVTTLKKNQIIKDVDNQDKVIGDIVEIYEKDFSKILDKYSNQVSNSIALFRNFDEKGAGGGSELAKLVNKIGDDYGDDIKKYVDRGLELAIEGQTPTAYTRPLATGTKILANIHLSGLSAPIKNFGAGQTQNVASFKTGQFFKGWGEYLLDKSSYDRMTRSIGSISDNVDEIGLGFKGSRAGKAFSLISFPFRWVERLNRGATVAIADVSIKDAFNTLLKNKKGTYFNSPLQARKALKDAMSMNDDGIDYMLNKLKGKRKYKDGAFDLLMETDGKFKDLYNRGLYKSQAATQGVTSLPYIPVWMADENKKWATLFYRTAYRVTENTYKRTVVPFVTEGNPFPLLKLAAGSALTGIGTYELYYKQAVGKDLLANNFREMPLKMFNYALKGELLGIFSNFFDETGSTLTSFMPAMVDFSKDSYNHLSGVAAMRDMSLVSRGLADYSKKISIVGQSYDIYRNLNSETNLKYDQNRRSMYSFLDSYQQYKNEDHRLSVSAWLEKGRSDVNEKNMHYKLLAEALIYADTPEKILDAEKVFIKTRAFLEHKEDNQLDRRGESYYYESIRQKVHKDIITSMTNRLRPYPSTWDENHYGQIFSEKYLKSLTEEERGRVKELLDIYKDRIVSKTDLTADSVLDQIINKNLLTYHPSGLDFK